MNPTDKAYFKAAQVIEPIDDLVILQPSSLVLTHTGDQNIVDDEGSFNSNTLGQQDCVNGWGTGGDHCWFAPVPSSLLAASITVAPLGTSTARPSISTLSAI